MDAIETLKKDHDRIRSLFSELNETTEPQELQDCFDKLSNILTIHAEAEEQVLYPKANNCQGTGEVITKGYEDHDKGDQMVLEIKSINPSESEFKQKVKELQSFMLNHLEEEENDLFPKVRQGMDDHKLEELATEIKHTKAEVASKVVD